MLDTWTELVQEKGMTWSAQECAVIENDEENSVFLSGSKMMHNKDAEYPGVSICKDGVTTTRKLTY